jgi:hypothetical protein
MRSLKSFLCSAFILSSVNLLAEDYAISLETSSELGDKFEEKYTGTLREKVKLMSEGDILRENDVTIHATFEGTKEILEVDDSKRGLKLKYTISKCTATIGNTAKVEELLQKGTEIIVEREGKRTSFLLNDKPLPRSITKILDLFVSIPGKSNTSDDDVFGSKERRKVGESWKIKTEKIAKYAADQGVKVDPKNITGETTLEKVVDIGGVKCLLLKGKITMKDVTPPLPPGTKIEKAAMKGIYSGEHPVDNSKDNYVPLKRAKELDMEMVARSPHPNGGEVLLEMEMSQSVKGTIRLLKKKKDADK